MVVSGARFILTINLCDSGTQRTVGRFEAKQKLSELVERVSEGEQIGVTKRGKLTAHRARSPTGQSKRNLDDIERVRKRAKPLPKGMIIKDLIEGGRSESVLCSPLPSLWHGSLIVRRHRMPTA